MTDRSTMINATNTSLEIIDLIKSEDGVRMSEIARQLDLSKSTVHKHLNTLRNAGFVTKEGEIYHIGLQFFHLGQYARRRNDRYSLAEQKAAELADEMNHAVDFDVETNGRVMTLFHEADESAEIGFTEGDYFYAHTSSTGKAILAELSEERIRDIIDKWGLSKKTPQTITETSELLEEIQRIRERGYAVVDEEWLEGHRAVGVAVSSPEGRPFGALSAGGPTYRLTDDKIQDEVAPALLESAAELEDEICEVIG